MSWRDNSSSSTNGTNDGSGGSMSGSGGVSGTGGGGFGGMRGQTTGDRGGYTFRGVPGTRKEGNWNTGGAIVGTGSMDGGINRPQVALPRVAPRPQGFNRPVPLVQPPAPVAPFLGPNANMINTLPQIGGTVPSQIQQTINGLNYGPTSFPGTPNGPQIGGVDAGGITSQFQDTTSGGKFGSGSTQSYGVKTDPSENYGNDQYGLSLGWNGNGPPAAGNIINKTPGTTRSVGSNLPFGPRNSVENPITANRQSALEDTLYGWTIGGRPKSNPVANKYPDRLQADLSGLSRPGSVWGGSGGLRSRSPDPHDQRAY